MLLKNKKVLFILNSQLSDFDAFKVCFTEQSRVIPKDQLFPLREKESPSNKAVSGYLPIVMTVCVSFRLIFSRPNRRKTGYNIYYYIILWIMSNQQKIISQDFRKLSFRSLETGDKIWQLALLKSLLLRHLTNQWRFCHNYSHTFSD